MPGLGTILSMTFEELFAFFGVPRAEAEAFELDTSGVNRNSLKDKFETLVLLAERIPKLIKEFDFDSRMIKISLCNEQFLAEMEVASQGMGSLFNLLTKMACVKNDLGEHIANLKQ